MGSKKIILLILFLVTSGILSAQVKDGSVSLPDTFEFPYIRFSEIAISGNKLTKDNILIRELDFTIGDSLSTFLKGKWANTESKRFVKADSSELCLRMHYSRENLINTKLFLTVNLSIEQLTGNSYRLHINVTERHYWWLFPVVKLNAPNFNEWIRAPHWSDVSMGLFFSHNNLWGKSHQSSLAFYLGKSYAFAFGYYIPWIGHKKKTGLLVAAGYQNLYTVEYAAVENKRQMIYDNNALQIATVAAALKLRPGLYNYGTIKLTGEWVQMSDSLYSLDTNYLAGHQQSNASLSLYADYYYDARNNHTYPLRGNLLRVFVDKRGLGLLDHDVDLFYYGIDFHFYQKLSRKFYVAEMVKCVNSSGQNYPYYYQQVLPYKKDFIRGYDLYTIRGDQMYYFRSNIKYELISPGMKKTKPGQEENKFKNLPFAFYANVFADCGYVVNKFTENNPLNNKMLYSWGLGIDFVTYYDMVLRFEYAWTSTWQNGFYFGFGMPI